MLDDVVEMLACPVCRAPLVRAGRALRCAAGHGFDLARQGYVNLLSGTSPHRGDTADMVAARDRFLRAGWYRPIADAVVSAAAADAATGAVLDLGAGTGWYLAEVLDAAGPDAVGLALDVSAYAARRAARCHPRAGAAVADTWGRLPVRDGAASVVLDVFAPRNPREIARVLRPGGLLVVVTPRPRHLAELRGVLGLLEVEPDKEERLAATLAPLLDADGDREVEWRLRLAPSDVSDVVGMGPSAWHRSAGGVPAEPVEVTASVRVGTYRRPG